MLAPSLGPSNARVHPLAEHGSLKLGEGSEHLEHEPPGRGLGVDRVAIEVEDAQLLTARPNRESPQPGSPEVV